MHDGHGVGFEKSIGQRCRERRVHDGLDDEDDTP